MKWHKKGLIIEPQNNLWWMQTHAMLPTTDHIDGDIFRIYFSGRDAKNRSQIGFANAEVRNGNIRILEYSKDPIITVGERGCFDDNGVTPSWIINHNGKRYLYYIGWNSGTTTIRMSLIAGLAISIDEGSTFNRYSRAPLLERTNREPYTIMTAPCVLKEEDKWRLYYVSCEGWIHRDLPKYNIKYAESEDGINWKREGVVCIDFLNEKETALARPCVLKDGDKYLMWYSYKDPAIGYRIGFADSDDGINWERKDELAGISIAEQGWDSEMIQYSFVFEHNGIRYMLYNGNIYGISGAGYAVME